MSAADEKRLFELYEDSVQSPGLHVDFFQQVFREVSHREPRVLREDFCGTARLCFEWLARDASNRATGVDLSAPAIAYARSRRARLPAAARKRLSLLEQDVRRQPRERADLAVACNFSVYILHEEQLLLRYFQSARAGLAKDGLLILEVEAGTAPPRGNLVRRRPLDRQGHRFDYRLERSPFDRKRGRFELRLSFKPAGEPWLTDAFRYDCRRWPVATLRRCLLAAGFSRVGFSPHPHPASARTWVTFVIAAVAAK